MTQSNEKYCYSRSRNSNKIRRRRKDNYNRNNLLHVISFLLVIVQIITHLIIGACCYDENTSTGRTTTKSMGDYYKGSTIRQSAANVRRSPSNSSSKSNKTTTVPPSWEELDQRDVPSWYDEMKFGIFIHWGVFSVPAYRTEWFWYYWETEQDPDFIKFIQQTEQPGFSYVEYASRFKAEFYNPQEWSNIFAQSGAQYVVLTSKHHDGYCNWNSTSIPSTWNWNVMDVGPRRDILGELNTAIKNTVSPFTNEKMKFGVYHSLFEWYNLMYEQDKANNYTTQDFIYHKTLPELYDLVNRYEPDLVWSDGEWMAHSDYWNSREFINWYITQSPVAKTAIWNDRWGSDVRCHYGSYLTCDDRYNPNQYQHHKFENAFTIDTTTWGYSRYSNITNYMSVKELIHTIIQVVAYNGNVLINIGPAADGTIHPIFVDRLLGIGDWLKVNGEAIYRTKPWLVCQNETASNVFYTTNTKTGILYVHFLKWPADSLLHLDCPIAITNQTTIRFIGIDDAMHLENNNNNNDTKDKNNYMVLQWKTSSNTKKYNKENDNINNDDDNEDTSGGIDIFLPNLTPDIVPCQHAWVLAIRTIANWNHPLNTHHETTTVPRQ